MVIMIMVMLMNNTIMVQTSELVVHKLVIIFLSISLNMCFGCSKNSSRQFF